MDLMFDLPIFRTINCGFVWSGIAPRPLPLYFALRVAFFFLVSEEKQVTCLVHSCKALLQLPCGDPGWGLLMELPGDE